MANRCVVASRGTTLSKRKCPYMTGVPLFLNMEKKVHRSAKVSRDHRGREGRGERERGEGREGGAWQIDVWWLQGAPHYPRESVPIWQVSLWRR